MSTRQDKDGSYSKVVIGLRIMQDDEAEKYLEKLFNHEQVKDRKEMQSAGKGSEESQEITIRVRY